MRRLATSSLLLVCAGCGPQLVLTPDQGSLTGQYVVTATDSKLSTLTDPLTAKVGDSLVYSLVRDGPRTLHFTVQGGQTPGPTPVAITDRNGLTLQGSFTFTGPADPHFARMVAMGASLTMGIQTSSVTVHSQTHGPAFQLAHAVGASLALPLVHDGWLPTVTADDFDKATCRLVGGDINSLLQARAAATLSKVSDPSGAIHVDWLRVDPHAQPTNVAIGGFHIAQDITGGGGLFPVTFEHLVWDPFATGAAIFSDPQEKMLDVVVGLAPTVVVSTDLYINDLDNVNLGTSGIPDLSALTSMTDFKTSLDTILTRLDGTGADLFFADAPDITLLPPYTDKVHQLLAAGFSQSDATSWFQGIQQRTDDMDAALQAEVALHPRLHIVPFHAKVAEIFANGGLDVVGTHLTIKPFGGLFSLDNLHFSDTAYGMLAQLFVDAVNQAYGTSIPPIDLGPILAQDPFSVANLRAAGFICAGQ